jgi:hypothetical protein
MTTTHLNLGRDVQGFNAYAPDFSNLNYNTTLVANVEQNFTVPSTYPKFIAIFSSNPGASIWVDSTTTASIPGGSFTTSTSTLNPAARTVYAGDVISFVTTDTTAYMGVSLYVVQQ